MSKPFWENLPIAEQAAAKAAFEDAADEIKLPVLRMMHLMNALNLGDRLALKGYLAAMHNTTLGRLKQAELEALLKADVERLGAKNTTVSDRKPLPGIRLIGERSYSVGDGEPITVTDGEDAVLQAFLEIPSMDAPMLRTKSGYPRAPRILGDLTKKYNGLFAVAIRLPGKKSKGGYHVSIEDARPKIA